ncbi:MAG: orotate phosphoribosyltransferase [Methanomassiliicoccales archaeon]
MESVRNALVGCGALMYGEFTLASGKKSKYYIDIKKASTNPEVLAIIADEMATLLHGRPRPDRIAGVVLGSVPMAVALSLRTGIPFVMVRKEKKDHGTSKLIEGSLEKGMRVLVVEDVVTSAGSAVYAIDTLRAEGAVVDEILAVVDREEGGLQALEAKDVELRALVTATEVLRQ